MRVSVLPIMVVLTVIAGAVGLQLGESAIGNIDPAYFQGVEPPRDVTKAPRPPRQPGFAEASGWAEGYQARAEDCGDCPAFSARQTNTPQPAAPLYAYSDTTIEPRWEQADASGADDVRIERSLEATQVQRYLHYPVSADQVEIRQGVETVRESRSDGQDPPGL